jgi:hypothetical protein
MDQLKNIHRHGRLYRLFLRLLPAFTVRPYGLLGFRINSERVKGSDIWRFTANQFLLEPSPFRLTTRIFFQLNTSGRRPYITSFLTEDGSVIYNCCWPSPAQLFSGPSSTELMTTLYSLRFEAPPTRIYIPQEHGDPVIPSGTGFPFRRLLRFAGLRWSR